jgi:hypothetical protein
MADVFISYAHEDRDVVRELTRSLKNAGFSAWWDREISVGVDLTREIERQLESCKAVIVVWSASAVRSTWVISEASSGLDNGKLIPMQIDSSRIPLPFRVCHTATMWGWPAENHVLQLQKLILSVRERVTGEAIDEHDARNSNDRLDPTVSIRVANRVKEALQQIQPSAENDALALRVELEASLANFALEILNEKSSQRVLADFLGTLDPLLRTSYINVWSKDTQIYGWDERGLELAEQLGEQNSLLLSEDVPGDADNEYLTSNRLKWAYMCRRQDISLSLGSLYSSCPISSVLNRLEMLCELVAKHESQSQNA